MHKGGHKECTGKKLKPKLSGFENSSLIPFLVYSYSGSLRLSIWIIIIFGLAHKKQTILSEQC